MSREGENGRTDEPSPTGQGEKASVDGEKLQKIWDQIHFYFSDSNFPRDKYLLQVAEEDGDGFVDLELLCTFKRMKDLEATVGIIQGLFEKKSSNDLELSDTRMRVRRTRPVPKDIRDQIARRTTRVRGWTEGSLEPSLEELRGIFSSHGSIKSIRFQRRKDAEGKTLFAGAAYIEFASEDEAERLGEVSIPMPGGETCFEVHTPKSLAAERSRAAEKKKQRKPTGDGDVSETIGPPFVEGLILAFEGVGPGVAREDVRELLDPFGEVAWVEYEREEADGFVRFSQPGRAAAAVQALSERKSELGGKVPDWRVVVGIEEAQYWRKVENAKEQKRSRSIKRKRDSRRSNRQQRKLPRRGKAAEDSARAGVNEDVVDHGKVNDGGESSAGLALTASMKGENEVHVAGGGSDGQVATK